jgi:uncharacterized membrane protein
VHWGINGQPNGWVARDDAWQTFLLTSLLGLGVYCLFRLITKIDPKKRTAQSQKIFNKIGFASAIFITTINFAIVVQAQSNTTDFTRFVIVITSLLLAFIGNMMHNLKPNYFLGVRTPWTLENEDNWRNTHRLASKLWFVGGLLTAVLGLILPREYTPVVFISIVAILAIIPVGYSFLLFKKSQKPLL